MIVSSGNLLFQGVMFRCYASFREATWFSLRKSSCTSWSSSLGAPSPKVWWDVCPDVPTSGGVGREKGMTGAEKNTKSMEIRWDQCKSHAKCANSGWSILLHPDFWDTLGSFGRIMGNQALLDHQVRDWSCADPENMENIIVILDTNSHYIPLIMKPRESSRPTCWDQISVRWSKSLRAKASCAMQVFWFQFALWGGGSGAMSEPCPIQNFG